MTQIGIARDGGHIAEVDITETSFGRFFAAEVPGVGTYRITATMEDGTTYGSADIDVREDATTGGGIDEGRTADR